MKTMAVICEYNPFHNGHAYQICQHRAQYGIDCVVAVMSGNFVQRGVPAIFDKWTRAETALCGGCDLVIEQPAVYAVQSAERFAHGAVKLVNALPRMNYLSFGSECGDIVPLRTAAQAMLRPSFMAEVLQQLKSGISYASACTKVLYEILGEEYRLLLSEPNNILAIEYLKALEKENSRITPITLKRTVAHHQAEVSETYCCASCLRGMIRQGADISALMPPEAYRCCKKAELLGKAPANTAVLDVLLPYLLRTSSSEELAKLPDMTEGLETRFIEAGRKGQDWKSITESIQSKRYAETRINRSLMHILLGITKDDLGLPPSYLRVLGMNQKGADYLKEIKRECSLPIITKTANQTNFNTNAKRMFQIDCRATDIYAMLYPNQNQNKAGLDFTTSPIVQKL